MPDDEGYALNVSDVMVLVVYEVDDVFVDIARNKVVLVLDD